MAASNSRSASFQPSPASATAGQLTPSKIQSGGPAGWRQPGLLRRPGRLRRPSAEGGEQLLAGLFTPPACLRADPAVFVHLGVALALVGARPAGGHAGLEHGAGEVGVIAGVPGQHPAGGAADVSAVQAGADALDQVRDPGLAQARVGAGGAGLGAVEAFLDTPNQGCAVDLAEVGWGRCAASPLRGSSLPPVIATGFCRAVPTAGQLPTPKERPPLSRSQRAGPGDGHPEDDQARG